MFLCALGGLIVLFFVVLCELIGKHREHVCDGTHDGKQQVCRLIASSSLPTGSGVEKAEICPRSLIESAEREAENGEKNELQGSRSIFAAVAAVLCKILGLCGLNNLASERLHALVCRTVSDKKPDEKHTYNCFKRVYAGAESI